MDSGSAKMVQGVREVFEITDLRPSKKSEDVELSIAVEGKLVLIGKGLADLPWSSSLTAHLALEKALQC